jgi:hypothetical protein
MDKKPTRAQLMAAQYGDKLKKVNPVALEPRLVKTDDTETIEQKEKLIKAREKLATFKDLIW